MSEPIARELRPARPPRRGAEPAAAATAPSDIEARLDALTQVVTGGFAVVERLVVDGAIAPHHQLEEVVELLHASIDHLLEIERRLDALEAAPAAPPPEPERPARPRRTAKAAAKPDPA